MNDLDIAIIGLSGRFPKARTVKEFWQNIRDGVEAIDSFSDAELEASNIDADTLQHPRYVKAGAPLADIEWFDASFFGFSPREAEIMDPQHRFFLECAWESLEDAGYVSEQYKGSIGVYAGVGMNTYLLFNLYPNWDLFESVSDLQMMLGNDKDFLTTRASYKLNLDGPSVTVQSACSTSLVAVHLACQSLLSGECDMALAGGVTIRVPQKAGYLYDEGGIVSSDGHCRAFDAKGQGTVFSNGIGLVVLKRLEDALTDGDTIHAIIKGSAINNDGALKIGYTAPRIDGQAQVIKMAQSVANVNPETISYIEAHGTGTVLGDPIEIAGLTKAFRTQTDKRNFCAIGSVKTNIGHLDIAAGIAGLIKTVLALKHKLIPPSLHFEQPNPKIDFVNSPFFVNTTLSEWKTNGSPRRAGVSSFGIGGTNAHIILEEAPTRPSSSIARPWQLLLISAQTESALETAVANLHHHLAQHPQQNLADVAFTLHNGRRVFKHRCAVVCRHHEEAQQALADPKRLLVNPKQNQTKSIIFMFPGQGTQYINMAWELYQTESTFQEQIDTCADYLFPHLQCDLRQVLYQTTNHEPETAALQLQQTKMAQVAIFVIEYALAQLWLSWGIQPQAMIGHSIGEYVAACLANVFTLEDALKLVAIRGHLMQQLPKGRMLAISLPEEDIYPLLGPHLSMAAYNGPNQCVVSGPTEAAEALYNRCQQQGITCRYLHTSHAFHSEMIDPILGVFVDSFKDIKLSPPQIPYISNVTGTWITAAEATNPTYWGQHMRQTVRFADGIKELLQDSELILLEVGPGNTLSTLTRKQTDLSQRQIILTSLPHAREKKSDLAFILTSLGRLWVSGMTVDGAAFYKEQQRHRVPLPTYPFERQRYWIEPRAAANRHQPDQPPQRQKLSNWFYAPIWKQSTHSFPVDIAAVGIQGNLCWLIFNDACGLGMQIEQRLKQSKQDVIMVNMGKVFEKIDTNTYTLNPQSPDHYEALFRDLHHTERMPHMMVHLWHVTPANQTQFDLVPVEESQLIGFYSLLFLQRVIDTQKITKLQQIIIISNNMQAVSGLESLQPEKAPLLVPSQCISAKHAPITCCSIDINLVEFESRQAQRTIDQLLVECAAGVTDPIVAYRNGRRWIQTFEPIHLSKGATPLNKETVYLIFGGLGHTSFALTKSLVQATRSKLILVEPDNIPDRETWESWLATHPAQDVISDKIGKVQILERAGSDVFLLSQTNLMDVTETREGITRAIKQFGPIHTLIDATEMDRKAFDLPESLETTFFHKTKRIQALHTLLKSVPVDCVVFCSSLAGLFGHPEQLLSGAVSALLNAITHCQDAAAVSINWDTWQSASETGITPTEAVEAFGRILSQNIMGQVIVSTTDIQPRLEHGPYDTQCSDVKATPQSASSGKRHPRPTLQTHYEAPRNETEQALAELWQKTLHIEQIGIHDNFFELGGDSILTIQIVAEANRVGLQLTSQQLFTHQTIAQLATVTEKHAPVQAEQGIVTGPVPLTPMQSWFLEQNQPTPECLHTSILLEVPFDLKPSLLRRAIRELLTHHDALRMRFESLSTGWQQVLAPPHTEIPFTLIELSTLPSEQQQRVLEMTITQLQESLNLLKGVSMALVLFHFGNGQPGRLLLVIHPLIADDISQQILLRDLLTLYQQLAHNQSPQLLAKTTSFKEWAYRLQAYGQTEACLEEVNYWLAESRFQAAALPIDFPEALETAVNPKTNDISVALSENETHILLREVPQVYNTQTKDILLTALVHAHTQWTGEQTLLIDLEGDNRTELFKDIDVSRTVGWFTATYPVCLSRTNSQELSDTLKTIKEQLRQVPNQGLGYNVLRYQSQDINQKFQVMSTAQMKFNYIGQFELLPHEAPFKVIQTAEELIRSPLENTPYLLEITALITEGRLQVNWGYKENVHHRATIKQVADNFLDALRQLIAHCQSPEAGGYTPSDFPKVKLSQKDLDNLFLELNGVIRSNE